MNAPYCATKATFIYVEYLRNERHYMRKSNLTSFIITQGPRCLCYHILSSVQCITFAIKITAQQQSHQRFNYLFHLDPWAFSSVTIWFHCMITSASVLVNKISTYWTLVASTYCAAFSIDFWKGTLKGYVSVSVYDGNIENFIWHLL